MTELNSKYGTVLIYAETLENEALSQIIRMSNSQLGENAHIRIMPDAHAGAGCTIGTTMKITDKICPNLVGVDIACGVTLVYTDIHFKGQLEKVDKIFRENIPFGTSVRGDSNLAFEKLSELKCWDKLDQRTKSRALCSTGTLGSGNHYYEIYENGAMSVHTGSRNIGLSVAKYYQDLAIQRQKERMKKLLNEELQKVPERDREQWLKNNKPKVSVPDDLAYLTGDDMEDYLHDCRICHEFASLNRHTILSIITKKMKGKILEEINSIHNYIDTETMILRKGAIDASAGKKLVIPLNMRDGVLLCEGKGNEEWNYSAPHGAGRLYSRSEAKNKISLSDYKKSMMGIYSTCVNHDTIDESPMAYKDSEEIKRIIGDTVVILEQLRPIYNFKASEE